MAKRSKRQNRKKVNDLTPRASIKGGGSLMLPIGSNTLSKKGTNSLEQSGIHRGIK